MQISNQLQSIVIGTILGDAHVTAKRIVTNKSCLSFVQKRQPYIDHLYGLFREYVTTEPKKYNNVYRFKTISTVEFGRYRDLFYINGIKRIPENLMDLIDVRSLLYWFLDDGSYDVKNKSILLHTQNFTWIEQYKLKQILAVKFNLYVSIHKDRSYHRLFLGTKETLKFIDMTKPYFPSADCFGKLKVDV